MLPRLQLACQNPDAIFETFLLKCVATVDASNDPAAPRKAQRKNTRSQSLDQSTDLGTKRQSWSHQ